MNTPYGMTEDQILRYARQIILPEMGGIAQRKLLQAKVVLVGLGGLGSPAALYLAAAGVGRIGLVDCDQVDLSNLQRQILYTTPEVGHSKLEAACHRLMAFNPEVEYIRHETRLHPGNALEILGQYDLVLDGTDNFPTRYLVNDACVMLKKPLVHAGVFRFEGQLLVIHPKVGPCYRCLYPEPPLEGMIPTCQESGILGVIPGVLGVLQTTEAIKILCGMGTPLVGALLRYHALDMEFRKISVRRDPDCASCGESPTIKELQWVWPDQVGSCDTARMPQGASLAGSAPGDEDLTVGVRRLKLTFPETLINEPVLFSVAKQYDVMPNIRKAKVSTTTGEVILELSGNEANLEAALSHFVEVGVIVDPLTDESFTS